MSDIVNEEKRYVIGLRLDEARPTYCYSSFPLKEQDKAVATVDDNDYLGTVVSVREMRQEENLSAYWPLVRKATEEDIADDKENQQRDLGLVKPIQDEANKLKLNMNVFRVYSSLDRMRVKVMYTSEERVDFRSLLRVLAPLVKARIEMRQVGPRDKAKMVGGLGICGLKLCCSTFLTAFDGISIAMAKNQMLAINIPKLSGQCGKLICCLKYEDQAYEEAKKDFPKLNTVIAYKGMTGKVTGLNVLSRTVTLYTSGDDGGFVNLSLDEFNNIVHPKPISMPAPVFKKPTDTSVPASTNNYQNSNQNRNYNNQRNNNQNYNNQRNNSYQNRMNNNNNRFNRPNSTNNKPLPSSGEKNESK